MTGKGNPVQLDDAVASVARRFKLEATAVLVQVCRDETASPSARAQAACRLLDRAEGRPAQARPLTVADVEGMSFEECVDLVRACFDRMEAQQPGLLWELMAKAVNSSGAPKSNRYTRGEPTPLPPHVEPPRSTATPARGPRFGGKKPRPPQALPAEPIKAPPPPPDPVPDLPPAASPVDFAGGYNQAGRPLHKIGYGEPSPSAGVSIRQDIVARSVQPPGSNGLAHDSAFGSYRA